MKAQLPIPASRFCNFFYFILIMHVYTISVIKTSRCICEHIYTYKYTYIHQYVRTHARIHTRTHARTHAPTHARTHAHTHTHSHQHLPTPGTSLHRPDWWLHAVLWRGNVHLKAYTLNLYNIPFRPIDGTGASFQVSGLQIIICFVTRLVC